MSPSWYVLVLLEDGNMLIITLYARRTTSRKTDLASQQGIVERTLESKSGPQGGLPIPRSE